MTREQSNYLSYLLRLWQANDKEKVVWRASLQSSRTHEQRGFADLDELFKFLREQTNATSERKNPFNHKDTLNKKETTMFLTRNGTKLCYHMRGTGEPTLLFVHGWLGSLEVWEEQVAAFSESHRVVSVDLRGFGQSDKPDGDYPLDLFADDLDFIIQELALDKPVFIGWSMAASIGLVYATAHPDKISKLVLVGGTPLLIASEDFPHAIPGEAAEQLLGALQVDFMAGTRGFIEMLLPEPDTGALKEQLHTIALQTTPAVALNSIGLAAGQDLRPLLSQVKIPTLILTGGQDQVCLPGASQYMHEHISNSEFYSFAGKGHCPFLTDAAAFNERLRDFVAAG